MQQTETTIIRFKELKKKLGISRSTVDRWEASKNFPRRIKLGENSVGWRADEVQRWIEERSKAAIA